MATINAMQRKALEVYADGEYRDLLQHEADEQRVLELAREGGDGLLPFLLVELSTKEDCTDMADGADRMETAIRDLQAVADALAAEAEAVPQPR